jgi:hypothetical protein
LWRERASAAVLLSDNPVLEKSPGRGVFIIQNMRGWNWE